MTTEQDQTEERAPMQRIADFDKGLDPFSETDTKPVKIDRLLGEEVIVTDVLPTEMTQDGEKVQGVVFLFYKPDDDLPCRTLSWSLVLTEQLLLLDRRQFPLLGMLVEEGKGMRKYIKFV